MTLTDRQRWVGVAMVTALHSIGAHTDRNGVRYRLSRHGTLMMAGRGAVIVGMQRGWGKLQCQVPCFVHCY